MSIASEITRLQNAKASIKASIENKGVTVSSSTKLDGYATLIDNIPAGDTPEAEEKDVNFYDYDGKRVYSYTKAEFLALNSFPENPTHDYLTAQGWNWDYQDAVNYVTEYGILDVGQMYITTDGSTRVIVEIPETRNNIYLGIAVNGSAIVDWGDGSSTETITGSSTSTTINTAHTYIPGEYTIKITPVETSKVSLVFKLLNSGTNITKADFSVINYIKEINVGNNIDFNNTGFGRIINDFKLSLPSYITQVNYQGFIGNPKILIFPKNLTSLRQFCINIGENTYPYTVRIITNGNIDSSTFAYNQVLTPSILQQRIIIADKATSFAGGLHLPGVLKFVVPKTISTISDFKIESCKILDFSHHETIPTLSSSYAFSSDFPSDCQIVVPDDLYEDWIAANNWTNYASQIISKSDFDNQ